MVHGRRLRSCLVLAAALLAFLGLASAAQAQADERRVEVVELRGPLDGRILAFAGEAIEEAATRGDVEAVVLQLDSPGVIRGEEELERLLRLVSDPPLPLAVWVGPAPAVAFGGAFQILSAAPFSGVAPGSEVGLAVPTVAGRPDSGPLVPVPPALLHESVRVTGAQAVDGVDVVQPSLRQFVILDLHGRAMRVRGEDVVLSTVVPFTDEDGTEGVTNLPTVIREPNVWDQFLRLAVTPEATFFFLVAGLTIAAFEAYAVGPGIAAGVAGLSLALAGYGVGVLPVRWWALALVLAAAVVLTAGHQMGGVPILSVLGVLALALAGFAFTDAAPQIVPRPAGVLLTVGAAAFFFLLAMPTVARSRFSTQAIGREGMIGRQGRALTPLSPDGEVEVEGARWRATSHREAGIDQDDPVVVVGVDGWYLEVEPPG